MRGRALRAALARLDAAAFDVVHVQTPFVAHYAGVRYARIECVDRAGRTAWSNPVFFE